MSERTTYCLMRNGSADYIGGSTEHISRPAVASNQSVPISRQHRRREGRRRHRRTDLAI